MELIIAVILFWLAWVVVVAVLRAAGNAASAGPQTLRGKGTLSENLETTLKGLGAFEVRLNEERLGEDASGPLAQVVQVRGLFPVTAPRRVTFVTSVIDITNEVPAPILCPIDAFQEPGTIVFQHQTEAGVLKPGYGLVSWSRAGVVIPEILQPPMSGMRTLQVILRVIDAGNPPPIRGGALTEFEHPGVLWHHSVRFQHVFDGKGYREAAEHREEAQAIAVKVGVAVAMADGELAKEEGEALKDWILRTITPMSGDRREDLKQLYNRAMKDAYNAAVRGSLDITPLLGRLNEIGERADKYDVMELCFEVMAADGIAHPAEMALIRELGQTLEMDVDEIAEMRDQRILSLNHESADAGDVEDLLDLQPDWTRERKLAHLRSEFSKWNGRLNTLPEGSERENAQRMLDLIAEARKKHG